MRIFRRRTRRPAPLQADLREAQIAVGSLSGIAPSDIQGHLLIVVDRDDRAHMTGNAGPELGVMILTQMAAAVARKAYASRGSGPS